jgi:hypothetical protein
MLGVQCRWREVIFGRDGWVGEDCKDPDWGCGEQDCHSAIEGEVCAHAAGFIMLCSVEIQSLRCALCASKAFLLTSLRTTRSQLQIDSPTIIHALSPQTLLLATDSSALHLYDLRMPSTSVSAKPQQTHYPHGDYISSLTPLPPSETSTSGFSKQWVTTGGTTLAVTDLRRGVMVRSEDQEEELISSVMVRGLKAGGTSKGEKVIVGGAGGVLTLWEKGQWDDQDERITVDRSGGGGESLETLTLVPDDLGLGKLVAVGLGDGRVEFVELGPNRLVAKMVHDEFEGVVGLGFDATGRMVSGGGSVVKVWHEAVENEEDEDEVAKGGDSDEESEDSSDDEMKSRKRTKKQKKNKGRGGTEHVMAFKGLD